MEVGGRKSSVPVVQRLTKVLFPFASRGCNVSCGLNHLVRSMYDLEPGAQSRHALITLVVSAQGLFYIAKMYIILTRLLLREELADFSQEQVKTDR
jgi:hypothetical protein